MIAKALHSLVAYITRKQYFLGDVFFTTYYVQSLCSSDQVLPVLINIYF